MREPGSGSGSRTQRAGWLVVAIGCAGASCDALLGLSDLSFDARDDETGGAASGRSGEGGRDGDDSGGSAGSAGRGGNAGEAGEAGDGASANGGDAGSRSGGSGGVTAGSSGSASGGKAGSGAGTDDTGGAGAGGSGGGSAGAGSGSAGAGAGGKGGGPNCRGIRGPTPVNIDEKFCIDATEVTNGQYAAFLSSNPPAPTHPLCAWNFNYTPGGGWPAQNSNLPVTYVDFCDAHAYCEWAGKRLCGAVGGGSFDYNGYPANRMQTELYYACSNAGRLAFPYGNTYDPTACGTGDLSSARPVGSPSCEGGFPGVFDLSGNAMEWQDSCLVTGGQGDSDLCRLGSYGFDWVLEGNPPGADFSCAVNNYAFRGQDHEGFGIRCCSDAVP